MKILILALSGIGDALMFTPTLDKIKSEFPNAKVDVLAMFKGVEEIYSSLPEVSDVIYFNFLKEGIIKSISFVKKLRKQKYDISINVYPANRKEYNVINWLIGAKKRLAAKYIRKDIANFGFLNNVRIKENDNTHNVETNFNLFSKLSDNHNTPIPSLKLMLNKDNISFADKFLIDQNINSEDIVVGFHPGCSTLKNHQNRRWTTEKFAELGKYLCNNYNCKILLFGAGEEIKLNDKIKTIITENKVTPNNIIIVTSTSILESVAVMKRCNLFVTNDSSLMHFAAALKLNIIPIIGPTNINYIYPWKANHKIASLKLECSPCFFYSPNPLTCNRKDVKYKCMKDINPEMVLEIAKKIL